MDKTLLVPLDNTEVSEKMLREADAFLLTWEAGSLSFM